MSVSSLNSSNSVDHYPILLRRYKSKQDMILSNIFQLTPSMQQIMAIVSNYQDAELLNGFNYTWKEQ